MEISGEWEAGMIYFNVKELWKEQWAGANLQTKALHYLILLSCHFYSCNLPPIPFKIDSNVPPGLM